MKASWILLLTLPALVLAGCAATPTVAESPLAPVPEKTGVVSSATTVTATSAVISTNEWLTYNNVQAGYSAKYPPDWTVNESAGKNGELVTTFLPPGGAQGLTVVVQSDANAIEQVPDMPNTRCQQVTISGLPARRCFDTVASSISTTFVSQNRLYTIASFGKHPDQDTYQGFLGNLSLTP